MLKVKLYFLLATFVAFFWIAPSAWGLDDLQRGEPGPEAAPAYATFDAGRKAEGCGALFTQLRAGSGDPWALRGAAICAHQVEGFADAFEEVLAERPDEDPLKLMARGYLAYLQGENGLAEERLHSAVQRAPDFALAWNALGAVRQRLGRFDEALAAIEEALELAPEFALARKNKERTRLFAEVFTRLADRLPVLLERWPELGEPRVGPSGRDVDEVLSAADKEDFVAANQQVVRLTMIPLQEREAMAGAWIEEGTFDELLLWWPFHLVERQYSNDLRSSAMVLEAWLDIATVAARRDALLQAVGEIVDVLKLRLKESLVLELSRPWAELVGRVEGIPRQRAKILSSHTPLLLRQGEVQRAQAALRRARGLYREAGFRSGEAGSMVQLGRVLVRLGDNRGALEVYRGAREIFEELATGSMPSFVPRGNTWLLEGAVLLRLDRPLEALAAYDSARQLYHEGGDTHSEAIAWAHQGRAYFTLNRNEDALSAYRGARRLHRKVGNRLGAANTWFGEARVLDTLGETEEAVAALQQARALFEQVGALQSIGNTWIVEAKIKLVLPKRSEEALKAFRRGRDFYRQASSVAGLGKSWNGEAQVLFLQGEFEDAAFAFRRARELYRQGGDPIGEALAWVDEGVLRLRMEEPEAAVAAIDRARHLLRNDGDPENLRNALLVGAYARSRTGDLEQAVHLARKATELHGDLRHTRITDRHRTLVDQEIASAYHLLVPSLLVLDRVEEALTWSERARSRVLLDLLSPEGQPNDLPSGSDEEEALTTLRREAERLHAELARNETGLRAAAEPGRRKALSDEHDRLLRQLRRNHYHRIAARGSSLVAGEPLDADGIRRLAGETGPLLVYFATQQGIASFLVRSDAPIRFGFLPVDQEELAGRIEELSRDLANPLLAPRAEDTARWLWDQVIAPYADDLPVDGPLTIIPHGPLHELPFAALRDSRGRYLFTQWDLSVAPSASVLATARARHEPAGGDASFVAFASGRGLPLTAREATTIASYLDDGGTVFTPTEARFERYREHAAEARQLLITTRGVFRPNDRRGSYLEILASPGVHDSRLTTAEIAAIPLEAELVVLAACDTARGRALFSDERLDFTRAFLIAGSAAVLATRWKVPESPATTRFLTDFYRAYRTGGVKGGPLRKDEALTAARRAALERGDPAQVWAAWTLVGDAR